MRIEELILEGFKSYPVRTTITGWDESFNAITGLNGSGKSNILDAICFVLGITNMTSVRATNLLDLIYKRGQAGVTKASVTIVFSNRDRATSPVGFEDHASITVTRQIAVGGITKYMLNGHKTTLVTLQSLFQSVQLNINSPNFLIMQGKITKVLNMKPQEILGMVEEASGTRMFEERKDKAWKTMGKKDKKVAEMEALLKEEITPKLDSLRAEKRAFLAYQKTTTELERLLRLVKAAEWLEAHRRVDKSREAVDEGSKAVEEKRELVRWIGEKRGAMEREVARVLEKRDKEFAKGGKLGKLTEAVKAFELDIEKVRTQAEIVERGIADETERERTLERSIAEIQASRAARASKASAAASSHAALKTSLDASTSKLSSDDELLQTLLTGLTSSSNADDNASGGYMGQIAAARAALSGAATEGEQAKLGVEHKEKELRVLEPKAKKAAKEGEGLGRELDEARRRKAELEQVLERLGGDEQRERELLEAKAETAQRMNGLLEKRDSLKSRLASTDFTYSDPTPSFDRTKVKGLVANLVALADKDFGSATALEVCAGGKLYNVIVEDEKVASALLGNKNSLKKRVTLLPLNKIQPHTIRPEKVAAAKKLAPGRVQTAISLVGFDDDVSAAMAFVFGGAFVCADEDAAKRVTFDAAVLTKSITLAGDVYDPSGTLSGGAAPKGGGVLVQVQAIRALEADLAGCRAALGEVEAKLKKEQAATDKVRAARRELEVKTHEVGLLEEQVNGSNAARVVADVAELKAAIAAFKEVIAASKDKQKQAKDDIKRLEKDMDDFKQNKDSKLNELKASIVAQRKALTKQTATAKAAQKDLQTAQMELEQVDGDVESAEVERAEAADGVARGRAELGDMQKDLKELEAKFASASAALKQEQAALASFDSELADLERDIKHKKQEASDAELAIKAAEHELQQHVADQKKWAKKVEDLEHQFTWIKDEKRSFGVAGTVFDFTDFDLGTSRNRCAELEDQQKGMKRKINPKVMNMIDSVEKKEAALKKMMATVLKDKGKIESTISELDQYKRDALQTTWKKVNVDFGAIFAELLPGNFAKLQPPDGMDITEGLEVKIRLGSVWKQSLTELSGGQRSLIALSLIMSLLQFKPAPMYILDEIDAALDLSHTQHIGQLFRNRFKGSQFIVVSLKEGLFTNANVLFKAKFVDGTSTVERTVTRTNNAMYAGRKSLPSAAHATGDKENAPAPKRGAAAKAAAAAARANAEDEDDDNDNDDADETAAGADGESFDLSGVQASQSQSQGRAKSGRQPLVGR